MDKRSVYTHTGRRLEELTMEGILDGRLDAEDFRISAETLLQQAQAAEAAGYPKLSLNFRRAAELTGLGNREVLEIYNMLRPGRASFERLMELADDLEKRRKAPLNAALVREAAEVYAKRGLTGSA
ncbi:MAG: diol dehydratase small subunit [Desulfarculaceae bacterium]|jgi:propanediol dehydratase small subunit